MTFKINLSEKSGKTFHMELETDFFLDKSLNDKFDGKELGENFEGYEFQIAGTSDDAGFTSLENVEGTGLKKVLLTYGKAMHKRPRKEGKKKVSNFKPKGLRMRKTVRGKVISQNIVQINLKTLKQGKKSLSEIFPEQNQPKPEPEWKKAKAEKPAEKTE